MSKQISLEQEIQANDRRIAQENRDKIMQRFKHIHFGTRYKDACISKLALGIQEEKKLARFLEAPSDILVYHGSPGIGKTYLCAALTEWAFNIFASRRYFREEDLLRRLRAGISAGQGDYLIQLEWLIDDQFVILDDVGSGINPSKLTHRDLEFRREIFFSFLDYRYRMRLPTVITSNFSKEDFVEVYSERIVSRLFASQNTIISNFNTEDDKRQQGL